MLAFTKFISKFKIASRFCSAEAYNNAKSQAAKSSKNSSLSALRVKFAQILQRKNDGFRENLQGRGRIFAGAFFA